MPELIHDGPQTLQHYMRDGSVDEGAIDGHFGHAGCETGAVVFDAHHGRGDDLLARGQGCRAHELGQEPPTGWFLWLGHLVSARVRCGSHKTDQPRKRGSGDTCICSILDRFVRHLYGLPSPHLVYEASVM
jgi:hypothetical protein